MNKFLTLIFILAFSFPVRAQEHTKRPPRTTPNPNTPRAATPGDTWSEFTSNEGRFSILMPGVPEASKDTVDSQPGPYTTHLVVFKGERNVYLVGWVDYDPRFNFNRQAELEANRDNFVKNLKATLVSTRALKIDGYQAIEFTAETPQRTFRSRVYMVGRRPYQIVIGSPKGVDDSQNVDKFFNSFKVSAS